MKCSEHPVLDAVSTCQACGKGLCPDCTEAFVRPLCIPCAIQENKTALAHNDAMIREAKKPMYLAGGLFVLTFALILNSAGIEGALSAMVVATVVAMTPAGWQFLGRFFNPGSGYVHLGMRWASAFVHLGMSMALGVIIGPIQILKSLRQIKRLKQLNAEIVASGDI